MLYMDIDIKKKVIQHCLDRIDERSAEIMKAIQQAEEAIQGETKSSAGDKYETSREMIQQDLDRYHKQLIQVKTDRIVLQKIELTAHAAIGLGAIVLTDYITYFIAVSLGQQAIAGINLMVISPSSPIGALLLGNKVGDHILFNGTTQTIQAIH